MIIEVRDSFMNPAHCKKTFFYCITTGCADDFKYNFHNAQKLVCMEKLGPLRNCVNLSLSLCVFTPLRDNHQ